MAENRIKTILRDKGISQRTLSKETGINYNTLTKILNNSVVNPSTETIKKIGVFLGVDYTLLLTSKDKEKVNSVGAYLDFHALGDVKFRKMIFSYLHKKGWKNLQDIDGTNDGGRDITGEENNQNVLFQLKCYQKIGKEALKKEIDTIVGKGWIQQKDIKRVVFCVACSVSANCRDDVQKYGKQKLNVDIEIRTQRELDGYVKATPDIISEFFNGTNQEIIEIVKNTQEKINKQEQNMDKVIESLLNNNVTDADIEYTKTIINDGDYSIGLEQAFSKYTKVKNNDSSDEKLGKLANLVGICYFKKEEYENAKKYFLEAKNYPKTRAKALLNLANVYFLNYINDTKRDEKDLVESHKTLKELLSVKNEDYSGFYGNIISSYVKVSTILKKNEEIKEFLSNFNIDGLDGIELSDYLFRTIANAYGILSDEDKAIEIVNKGLDIYKNSWLLFTIKADLLISKFQNKKRSARDLLPKFSSIDKLKEALDLYKIALEYSNEDFTKNELKGKIIIAESFIANQEGELYKNTKNILKEEKNIDLNLLPEQLKHNLNIIEMQMQLTNCNFDYAYKAIEDKTNSLPEEALFNLAQVFFNYGSPEKALLIFEKIKKTEDIENNIQYWIFLSTIYSMLNDLANTNKILELGAKKLVGNKDYKIFLQHRSGALNRFSKQDSERFVKSVFNFQKEFPDEQIVKSVEAIKDGELSDEIKSFLEEVKERYNFTKKRFIDNPVPIYFLKELYKKPTQEIFSFGSDNTDFDFITRSIPEDEIFYNILKDNFSKKNKIIFDYLSLYNLSNANLLGILKDLKKDLYIHSTLFNQIQQDLLQREDSSLRRLRDFIRGGYIKKIDKIYDMDEKDDIDKGFGIGMTQTIKFISKNKDYILICDDLVTSRFVTGQGGVVSNTFAIANILSNFGSIDKGLYSDYLYELSKLFIVFIRFDGEDLYNIYNKDYMLGRYDCKIYDRYRTSKGFFHIINQVQLSYSNQESFVNVFGFFLEKVIKSGFVFEDKLNAVMLINVQLELLQKKTIDLVYKTKNPNLVNNKDTSNLVRLFFRSWKMLIDEAKKDELQIILNEMEYAKNSIFGKDSTLSPIYANIKDYISLNHNIGG